MTADKTKIILYVDDEPKNLTSFKAIFRKHYQIYVANSAQDGMEMIAQYPIQLVITDQRMPNMTGVEFLEKIAVIHPEVTRVILTGYSDVEAIIDAINKGRVYRYITKPWKKEDLMITIDNALESYQLRMENRHLIAHLQKANRELDRFVYSAAHDLRAPVASLLGLINLMRDSKDLDAIKEYCEIQFKTVKKLDTFIADIIDFSRNSHLDIQISLIELGDFVNGILDEYKFHKNSDRITKTVEINQSTAFMSDKIRLGIILKNLISNAIRYTNIFEELSYLKIAIQVTEQEAQIVVSDNGQGIHEEHLPKIFDMFYRATDQNAGSGLGLYIVKETLEKIKGSIEVQSKYGEGSVFSVKIPNLANEFA